MPSTIEHRCSPTAVFVLGLGALLSAPSSVLGLVITEIHYHPPGSADAARRDELIEIYNEDPDPVDLTDYHFAEGIRFTFGPGTILKGFSYLVISADAARLQERSGMTNVVGDWDSSSALNNGGERIVLANPSGAAEAVLDYNNRGAWPAGADGTGHTLALKDVHADSSRAESWTLSAQMGGTPGAANFLTGVPPDPLGFNEALLLTSGGRWVELHNRSHSPVDLEGYFLTDDPSALAKARLAAGTIVPARGWITLEDVPLGLNFSPGMPVVRAEVFVALVAPQGDRVIAAELFRPQYAEASEARIPDGTGPFEPAAEPTRGAANRVNVSGDVVINELHYHPRDGDVSREFVELFHRGNQEVDLSGWQLRDGVRFVFPSGTRLAPGQYLVIGRDPDRLRATHGLSGALLLGPADEAGREAFGVLSDGGESLTLVDARGNTVDTVRYADGGEWPFWADGGGSTLELIDPRQDNDSPQAWDASDDSAKALAVDLQYTSSLFPGQSGEPEIHVMLLGRGITLVDDLSIPGEATSEVVEDAVLAQGGPGWRYFKGTEEPSSPPTAWREADFDDSSWLEGSLPMGYGEPTIGEGTTLTDMRFGYFSVYLRRSFELSDPAQVGRLLLTIDYDDGYVAYLNGTEVSRGDLDGNPPAHDAPATTSRESGDPLGIDLTARKSLLRSGTNVLAIQIHNNIINSPDAFLNLRLTSGRVVDVPAGWNMVPGGSFEEPLADTWLIEGTHARSGRSLTSPLAGAASLKVIATGAGDEKVNHIEQTLARSLVAGKPYNISLKARWVVGAESLLTIGWNFGLAKSHQLPVPENVGSPGAINGVTLRQAARAGDANLGPVIDAVSQSPVAPGDREPVTIRARVRDADGVAAVELRYALQSPTAPFTTVVMTGPDADGLHSARIDGQPLLTRIVYEIAATDSRGQAGRYPLDRTSRTHPLVLDPANASATERSWAIYGHVSPPTGPFPGYHFWLHKQNEDYLSARSVHSDDPVEGAFLFGTSQLHQDARIRFQGSALSRAGWGGSFRIRLPDDGPLHGRWQRFNLDVDGLSIRDRLSNYLIRNNRGATTVPYNNYAWVSLKVNSRSIGTRARIDPPGSQFVSKWFPEDADGQLFEIDERYIFSDNGVAQTRKNAYWLYPPAANEGPGDSKESYRFYFSLRLNEEKDDYSQLISAARLLTPSQTTNAQFDEQIFSALNVEEFCRVLAIRQNTGDWDTWAGIFGRSAYLYRPRQGAQWWLFHWDSDKGYGVDGRPVDSQPLPSTPLETFKNPFPEVERLLNRPRVKRIYYAVLKEMIDGRFSPAYLKPYLDELQALGATSDSIGHGRPGGFIDQRASLIRRWIGPSLYPQTRLAITTNGGQPLEVEESVGAIGLEGTAPADVSLLAVTVNGAILDDPQPGLSTTSFPAWSVDAVPLRAGANTVDVIGFNLLGDVVDSDTLQVTRRVTSGAFQRGDADGDGSFNLTDAIRILGYQFQGGALDCLDAADVDDNGKLEITDAIRLLNFLFAGADAPPPPFAQVGLDPTPDPLDCVQR